MLNQNTTEILPNWNVVAVNETDCFDFGDLQKHVKQVRAVYLYDQNEYTYLCEMTPSYFCRHLDYVLVLDDETPDDVRDRLYDLVCEAAGEDTYFHVSTVERIDAEWHGGFSLDGDFFTLPRHEQVDELFESYRGNPAF